MKTKDLIRKYGNAVRAAVGGFQSGTNPQPDKQARAHALRAELERRGITPPAIVTRSAALQKEMNQLLPQG